jgi:GGDEF domain-containing protein
LDARESPASATAHEVVSLLRHATEEAHPAARTLSDNLAHAAKELERMHGYVDEAYLEFLDTFVAHFLKQPDLTGGLRAPLEAARQVLAPLRAKPRESAARAESRPHTATDVESLIYHVATLLWSAGQPPMRARKTSPPTGTEKEAPASRAEAAQLDEGEMSPEISGLLGALAQAMKRNLRAVEHIESVRIALEQTDTGWEPGELRDILAGGANELLSANKSLDEELRYMHKRLSRIAATAALGAPGPVRISQRDVFLRSLEHETYRAHRYGYPLSVAVIDPARLVGSTNLSAAGAPRQMVRGYTQQVFSRLRASDIVGVHGRHSFAVAMPNTPREQALSALRKIQSYAAATHYVYAGRKRPIPGFYGGLTWYAPGETPATVLARAERALKRACSFDHHRIEVETPILVSRR